MSSGRVARRVVADPLSVVRLHRVLVSLVSSWTLFLLILAVIHFQYLHKSFNLAAIAGLFALANVAVQARFITVARKSTSPRKKMFRLFTGNAIVGIIARVVMDIVCSYCTVHWIVGVEFTASHYLAIGVISAVDQMVWFYLEYNVVEFPVQELARSFGFRVKNHVLDWKRILGKPFVPISMGWVLGVYVLMYFFGLSFFSELFK
jgi:hypothetical protein